MNKDLGLISSASPDSSVSPNISERAENKLCLANSLKLEGNTFFKQGNLKEAIRHYHRALLYIKGVESDGSNMLQNLSAAFTETMKTKHLEEKMDPNIIERNTQLKIDCYNNLAACLLKTEHPDFDKIVFYCDEVIKLTSCNPKTHFRMAQALFKLGDYNRALESCQKSLENQLQQDSQVISLKTSCLAHLAKQTSQEKVLYSKMLGLKMNKQ
ncbi:tetratricopeptide repeat protein 9A-like [Daphnia pulicaria]|uniref:tetratricopeptide repeat protein 9A-like n=1 Tax=Daphnia pulicaria TaxID=35523 RepID=UPI001EEB2732|nr:tetratricopeptide repeat protein 9A-like [Daphnia pulicaria]XP_046652144.1 tetratricopeptide repeat protein 9A-like [Daphnia pulicaria]